MSIAKRGDVTRKTRRAAPRLKPAPVPAKITELRRLEMVDTDLITKGLDARERSILAACQRIHRNNRGTSTPFNEFFDSLVLSSSGESLTPDEVGRLLDEFRDDLRREVEGVRAMLKQHTRELIKDAGIRDLLRDAIIESNNEGL
jgi:hypothetical protein